MGTLKENVKTVFDAAGFTLVTVVMYLSMTVTLPLTRESDSLADTVFYYYPPARFYLPASMFFSIWILGLAGTWLKRWAPGLPFRHIGGYLAAFLLLLWIHPLRRYQIDDYVNWLLSGRIPTSPLALAVAFLALFLFYLIMASASPEPDPPVSRPSDFGSAVSFWFFGWTLFYSALAGINTHTLFISGSDNQPFVMAGIAMAYWSFLLGLRVRALAGLSTRDWFSWGTLIAGLWAFCTAVIWVVFRIYG